MCLCIYEGIACYYNAWLKKHHPYRILAFSPKIRHNVGNSAYRADERIEIAGSGKYIVRADLRLRIGRNNHVTVGLDTIGDNAGNIPSPGEMLLYKAEREEQVQEAMKLVRVIAESLTEVQFRRLWLHHVQLENVRTIAKAEGVAHPSIVASITSAQRKILKIVQKHATKAE